MKNYLTKHILQHVGVHTYSSIKLLYKIMIGIILGFTIIYDALIIRGYIELVYSCLSALLYSSSLIIITTSLVSKQRLKISKIDVLILLLFLTILGANIVNNVPYQKIITFALIYKGYLFV